ncbi:MAG: LptF/LptG family permease [Elusimicrobiota bacterium]|jgi:lipopolysaccharide export system permease protein
MSLLGRYAVRRFMAPFLYSLGVFSLVVFLADLFDKMNRLVGTKASGLVVAQYLMLAVPYWTIRVVPVATFLAVVFSITGFMHSGEFIGLQASGVRPRDFFRPLIAASGVVALAALLLQETLLPVCYRQSQQLWHEQIHPEWERSRYPDAAIIAGPDRFMTVSELDTKAGTLKRPVMDWTDAQGRALQIDAKDALWTRAAWKFRNGVQREFDGDGSVLREESFKEFESDLRLSPAELAPQMKDPEEMGVLESYRYLKRVERRGERRAPVQTALAAKIAYPFTNLVLCALGIPIALRFGRSSRMVGLSSALAACFLYLWVLEAGRSLGNVGRISPWTAAFLPHLLFSGIAFLLYRLDHD